LPPPAPLEPMTKTAQLSIARHGRPDARHGGDGQFRHAGAGAVGSRASQKPVTLCCKSAVGTARTAPTASSELASTAAAAQASVGLLVAPRSSPLRMAMALTGSNSHPRRQKTSLNRWLATHLQARYGRAFVIKGLDRCYFSRVIPSGEQSRTSVTSMQRSMFGRSTWATRWLCPSDFNDNLARAAGREQCETARNKGLLAAPHQG
jgi:hypothetical protein